MKASVQPEEAGGVPKIEKQERLSKAEKLEREVKRLEEIAAEARKKALAAKREAAALQAAERKRLIDDLRHEAGAWMLDVLQSKGRVPNGFVKHLSSLPANRSGKLLNACEALWPESTKPRELGDGLSKSKGADDAPV